MITSFEIKKYKHTTKLQISSITTHPKYQHQKTYLSMLQDHHPDLVLTKYFKTLQTFIARFQNKNKDQLPNNIYLGYVYDDLKNRNIAIMNSISTNYEITKSETELAASQQTQYAFGYLDQHPNYNRPAIDSVIHVITIPKHQYDAILFHRNQPELKMSERLLTQKQITQTFNRENTKPFQKRSW